MKRLSEADLDLLRHYTATPEAAGHAISRLIAELTLLRRERDGARRDSRRLRECVQLILEDTEIEGVCEWGPDMLTGLALRLRRALQAVGRG